MPPKVRFQQQDIVDAAFALARKHGLDAINARSVASEIGCSTQPIFRVFENMDQLKSQVLDRAVACFGEYIDNCREQMPTAFKAVGMAYLLYAMDEPHLFHMVFLRQHNKRPSNLYTCRQDVIDCLMEQSGFERQQAELIHRHMWVFTYGLAAMLATGQLHYTKEELNEFLNMEYRSVVSGLLWEKAGQYNPPA